MKHIVTLEDGSTYKVARGVNIKRMKVGEKVTLTFSAIRRDRRGLGDRAGG